MKSLLTLLMLSACFLRLSAEVILEDDVSWKFNKMNLEDILNSISESQDLKFSYGNINLSVKKTISFEGNLKDGLELLFEGENIEYKIIGDQVVLKYGKIIGERLKGRVYDKDSQFPLPGASVVIIGSDPLIGTSTDLDGYFTMPELPVGRYDLLINFIGYEANQIPQVEVTTGKETFLKIELIESLETLDEVVVTASSNTSQPLNEMATLSARSFSVEETKRFAAAVSDPARMAQSFAGVAGGGDDITNEIIVRGNSSKGLLWRLEGVEIPNPNHFANLGGGGGAVSMLSSSTLSTSDFYTGAFPSEFGNALSGVFDLRLRNGNKDKREHAFQFGILGVEASTEGYFTKKSDASYLVNYRYSTLGILGKVLPTLEGSVPSYQDLSFKINVPTKTAGTFSIFGLGGMNEQEEYGVEDSVSWEYGENDQNFSAYQKLGILGVNNIYFFSNKTYLKTSLVGSVDVFDDLTEQLLQRDNYKPLVVDQTSFDNYEVTASIKVNHKFNAQQSIRAGYIFNQKNYNFLYKTVENGFFQDFLKNKGNTQFMQAFFQWQYKISEKWTLNTGVNTSLLLLNKNYSIDPRLGLKWKFKQDQTLSFAVGLHSKSEHISTYFIDRIDLLQDGSSKLPNKDLELVKALHVVGGYDLTFARDFKLKIEGYYQYLYDIPVAQKPESSFSNLNSEGVFSTIFMNDENGGVMVSKGKGVNYGVDITLEKSFTKGYYFLVTTSVFDSKFKTLSGKWYTSRYANNYILNLLGGKEFAVGKKQKNVFGVNGKFNLYGGSRQGRINIEGSNLLGHTVLYPDDPYSEKNKPYYRFDIGLRYTINAQKVSHSILFDVQNVTNHYNVSFKSYIPNTGEFFEETQNGAIPFMSYRLEF